MLDFLLVWLLFYKIIFLMHFVFYEISVLDNMNLLSIFNEMKFSFYISYSLKNTFTFFILWRRKKHFHFSYYLKIYFHFSYSLKSHFHFSYSLKWAKTTQIFIKEKESLAVNQIEFQEYIIERQNVAIILLAYIVLRVWSMTIYC